MPLGVAIILFVVISPMLIGHATASLTRKAGRKTRRWAHLGPLFECQYCNEEKREHEVAASKVLPYHCKYHLSENPVCKSCMDLAISVQLEWKPLMEVGCPECSTPWDSKQLRSVVGANMRKRIHKREKSVTGRSFQPVELPDSATTELLLRDGTRFW